MLAYINFVESNRFYYGKALDYFEKFIQKGNEDIVIQDVEFKLNEVIISWENVETEDQFYRNIPINDFLNSF